MINSSLKNTDICAEIAFAKEQLAHLNAKIKHLEEKQKLIDDEHLQIEAVNNYLLASHGRGRFISKATVYNGKVGYFCVTKISVDDVRRDVIIFACAPHDDIVLTDLSMPIDKNGFPINLCDKR